MRGDGHAISATAALQAEESHTPPPTRTFFTVGYRPRRLTAARSIAYASARASKRSSARQRCELLEPWPPSN